MSNGTKDYGCEPLSSLKFKRIVRPLLAKVNAINDLKIKYPSLIDFKFQPLHASETRPKDSNGSLKASLVAKSTNLHQNREDSASDTASESDYDYECSQEAIIVDKVPKVGLPRGVLRLVEAKNSFDRLNALVPFLSQELFQAYFETFQIFRAIITSMFSKKTANTHVVKLSTLASYKIGSRMALSTKTSYYKWNQSLLFDSETLPRILQQYQSVLYDDIDNWLETEPKLVLKAYTGDFLLGYIITIFTMNLRLVFYLLIPILIQWLHEEYILSKIVEFNSLKTSFFNEYWNFHIGSTAEDINALQELNGDFDLHDTNKIFWYFHRIGYWKSFIEGVDIHSNHIHGDIYTNYFLDSLTINKKVDFNLFYELTNLLDSSNDYVKDIYDAIRRNPSHPRNNNILMYLVAQLLYHTRIGVGESKTKEEFLVNIKSSYDNLLVFVKLWLGFSNNETVFTSVYSGNEAIFQATLMMCSFLLQQSSKACRQLKALVSKKQIEEYDGTLECYNQLRLIRTKCSVLYPAIRLLEAFYLDNEDEVEFGAQTAADISSCLNEVLFDFGHKGDYNDEFNELLLWLYDRQDAFMLEIAQMSYKKYYGNYNLLKHSGIQQVLDILFTYID